MKCPKPALLIALSCLFLSAQEPPPPAEPPAGRPAGPVARGGASPASQEPQPFEKVITKEARSKKGVFTVHQVKERYYYEIPKAQLDADFLWVSQIARTAAGSGYGGQALGNRVVRWQLTGNKVHLRDVNYELAADAGTPISRAVGAANNNAIIMTFPVAAFAPGGAPVVEVTRLFSSDVPEFSARQRLAATAMDASRSYIERVTPYPENIEAEASHTYTKSAGPAGAPATPSGSLFSSAMRPGSATVLLHFSMVKLPEKPMMPRLADPRVGYFTVSQLDFSRDDYRASRRRYLARWRLEKKDPSAALSEPVKPIVYWIDSATPSQWVPYLKRGVEKWQKAFEAAGFKNAIIAKLAPTPEQDPDFAAEDARYSVIRWLPSVIENASGPHVSDPRSGEILDSDIQFYHNVMNLARDWYFLQASPLDPRARKLPLPQDLMGSLIEFVCAHEVGHTLGFQHNMKSSSLYPQDKVRDREWVKKMGHTPSIMDYSRFNYVAQPEDKIDIEDLIPSIGPYDVWATHWGYAPIPGARSADEERSTLDQWAREQDKTPWLRFSTAAALGADPGELTEAVGDADAVKSSALGLKNLQRVSEMLLTATTTKTGEPYDDLAELYGRLLGQWSLEMNHVAAIVGGFDSHQKVIGQDGVIFKPIPKLRQVEAVRFLNENAFATPSWALNRDILRRIEATGVLSRVRNSQAGILANLLSSARFARIIEQEAVDGADAWTAPEFLGAVRKGVWKELEAPQVKVDAYRRNLQRAYLELANSKLNGAPPPVAASSRSALPVVLPSSGDEKPLYRAELKALDAALKAALARTTDRSTRAHVEGARDEIARILDPRFAASAPGAGAPPRNAWQPDPSAEGTCWPDYIVQP